MDKVKQLILHSLTKFRKGYFPAKDNKSYLEVLSALKKIPKIDHHVHLTCTIPPNFLTSKDMQDKLALELKKKHTSLQDYLMGWNRDNHIDTMKSFQASVICAIDTILNTENIVGFGLRLNPIKKIKGLELYEQSTLPSLESSVQQVFTSMTEALSSSTAREKKLPTTIIASFSRSKKYGINELNEDEAVFIAMKQIHKLQSTLLVFGGIDISGPEYTTNEQSPNIWGNVLSRILNLGWGEKFLVTVHLGDPSNLAGNLRTLSEKNPKSYLLEHYQYFSEFLNIICSLADSYPQFQFRIGHGYLLTPFGLLAPKEMQKYIITNNLKKKQDEYLQRIIDHNITMEVCPAVTARLSNWKEGELEVERYRSLPIFDWINKGIKVVLGTDSLYTNTSATLSENILRLLLVHPKMAEKILEFATIGSVTPAYFY